MTSIFRISGSCSSGLANPARDAAGSDRSPEPPTVMGLDRMCREKNRAERMTGRVINEDDETRTRNLRIDSPML